MNWNEGNPANKEFKQILIIEFQNIFVFSRKEIFASEKSSKQKKCAWRSII